MNNTKRILQYLLIVVGIIVPIYLGNVLKMNTASDSGVALKDIPAEAVTCTGAAQGMNGPVTVEVVATKDRIYSVKVVDQKETEGIGTVAAVEIPAKIFGAYDAAAALHLLLSALDEDARAARGASPDTKIERDLSNDKRILVISVVHRPKGARIGYRLYEHGETTLDGHVYKKRINYRDLEDVAAAIRVMGYRISELDAVGVAIPGTVHEGTVRLTAVEDKPFDLKGHLEEALEVPVFVENNANAAAVGCYVTQDDYETIVLHTQRTGALVGGQGTIVNGRLVRGRLGGAGELGYVARRLDMWDNVRELCWSPEGLCKIVAEFLLCSISSVAPEAAYVAVEMIPDPEPLRAELAKTTPVDYIPELIPVDDYHERIMIGELALCLNALRNGGDATKKKA